MKLSYHPDTDSLYVDLSDRPGVDAQEVVPGVVLDLDDRGKIVGIDIQHASEVVDLSRLESESLPVTSAPRSS